MKEKFPSFLGISAIFVGWLSHRLMVCHAWASWVCRACDEAIATAGIDAWRYTLSNIKYGGFLLECIARGFVYARQSMHLCTRRSKKSMSGLTPILHHTYTIKSAQA
ncbi:hypothetical protein F5Y15DRAFT_382558 [Xylariaceae sp. FL0016]|nr:hypothetical protein F5Y15DRAFT_382558 [Xylariaceae sp. FL0016]